MTNSSSVFLGYEVTQTLFETGQLIKERRLASGNTETVMAERLGVTRMTWRRIEAGDPNVRSGTLLQVLVMLQLKDRVIALSERDPLTTLLGRTWIPKRARSKRKPAAP